MSTVNFLRRIGSGNSMGPDTCEIPMELYEMNRARLIEELIGVESKLVVLLQGGNTVTCYDTQYSYPFRQESFFMWTFGVTEPGCYGLVDVDRRQACIFFPDYSKVYGSWKVPELSLDHYAGKYATDSVHYTGELQVILTKLKPDLILILGGQNNDGVPIQEVTFPGKENFQIDKTRLYPIMVELRVRKTYLEYEVMKYVIQQTSFAHKRVMKSAKPGRTEYFCESEFFNVVYGTGGCQFLSHPSRCASGKNTAYICYGNPPFRNEKFIAVGDLCLFNMGASYYGYCADVTCTFPTNGKFSKHQKLIYEVVLEVSNEVINHSKPGVSWLDMHLLGNRVLLERLRSAGLLHGDLEAMLQAGLASVFQPHGIGHLLGLDRYDVGGYSDKLPPREDRDIGLRDLRTTRVLEEGMFLTVGPGCYFIDDLLDNALKDSSLSKFINANFLAKLRALGGVQIEDDVYIHNMGAINLTKAPRTVEQIEDWLAGIDYDDLSCLVGRRVSSVRFFN